MLGKLLSLNRNFEQTIISMDEKIDSKLSLSKIRQKSRPVRRHTFLYDVISLRNGVYRFVNLLLFLVFSDKTGVWK